ncbi:MAG: primosomal protein N' [Xanthomonadales bacterium]|jgi:primosomal protein N' (replication factor Y)|nr:primosomal protein N' [Xanthomonadales bacterium]
MGTSEILRVALPVPLPTLFDYLPSAEGVPARPGGRVLVSFGSRKMVGVVVETSAGSVLPAERLQQVEQVLDGGAPILDGKLIELLRWCWQYYKRAPGDVVGSALPPALRSSKGRIPDPPQLYRLTNAGVERLEQPAGRARVVHAMLKALEAGPASAHAVAGIGSRWRKTLATLLEQGWAEALTAPVSAPKPRPGPQLIPDQAAAVKSVLAELDRFRCHLLDGVTGSGKTEVYMCLLEAVLAKGLQALVLVPEIGLTPQLLRRFRQRLGLDPVVIHSGLSAGERLASWNAARTGRAPLLVGTRSALFTPLPRLGLIVLDEEHDASFKQQEGFRYSARDVAVKRAAELDIPVVLGSATPSLESLQNAGQGRYGWLKLRERATSASMPAWRVLDLRQQTTTHGLARPTLEAIGQTLERDEQVMVFLNRRGYAPVLMCQSCGWFGSCERCDANLTWHRRSGRLCCHHCGHQRRVPDLCPDCAADALVGAGEGTQQLEEYLERCFPDAPILRFDRDQISRKGVMDEQLDEVRRGQPCLLVGTQMLAKGHHFPAVTLVVIVNIDQALYSADYRALERMGQMILQVAGRAGRSDKPGTVMLQTLHPEHAALQLLLERGYEAYASWMLEERVMAGLPPSGYQALLRADAHVKQDVERFLRSALTVFPPGVTRIFGPMPAIMERLGGRSRMYLVLLADSRSGLHGQVDAWLPRIRDLPLARKVRWSIDIDPQEL